jgi:sterol-4alpha-carboxylate 3-dehydrogenase (decarboxylating)
MNMDPVLVIGGCGSLGHHVVQQLLESGDASDVTVLDINNERNLVPGAKYIKGNISVKQDVLTALQSCKPRTIIHTASPLLMEQRTSRKVYEDVNIKGTNYLLSAIHEVGTTKVLVYSSASSVIHDNLGDIVNATEDHPYCLEPEQTEYYTHTKAIAEMTILQANRKNGLLTVAIRPTTMFGEGDPSVAALVSNAKTGRNRLQVGDGNNMVDWTYTGNAAHGHILAAQALLRIDISKPPRPEDEAKRVDGEAFVVSNDDPWPFWELVRMVGSTAGYPVNQEAIWVVPSWLFYSIAVIVEWSVWVSSFGRRESLLNRKMVKYLTMNRTFDITKAKERLGYKPKFSISEGIELAVHAQMRTSMHEVDANH